MAKSFSKLQEKLSYFGEDKNFRRNVVMIATVIMLMVGFIIIFNVMKPNSSQFSSKGLQVTDFTKTDELEDEWMIKSQNYLRDLEKNLKKLETQKAKQADEIQGLHQAFAEMIYENQRLAQQVESLQKSQMEMPSKKETVRELQARVDKPVKNDWQSEFARNKSNTDRDQTVTSEGLSDAMGIQTFIANNGAERNIFKIENYLPAGSYAEAVLISSVDASVGVTSQADPRPVLFRVTSAAYTAKYEDQNQKIEIEGCTVTGAASGDLSSEKVYIRLLKMTCSNDQGEVIETQVNGYAAALGKAGIRGPVVSREGDYLVKSFFAGLAGSVGEGVEERFASTTTFTDGLTSRTQDSEDIIRSGIGAGLSDAMDRLANYLIDRAEQYQPVISIPAGVKVELVFIDGVKLDGSATEQAAGQNQQSESDNSRITVPWENS